MQFCKVPVYVNISSCTLIVQCYDQGSNKTNKQKLKDTLDLSSRKRNNCCTNAEFYKNDGPKFLTTKFCKGLTQFIVFCNKNNG